MGCGGSKEVDFLTERVHGEEGKPLLGRPPKNNWCFKCGAKLYPGAEFCADCGTKLPKEGDTETWREKQQRLEKERAERRKKEDEERLRHRDTAASGPREPKSNIDKPKVKRDTRGLSLKGETEEEFRRRQNLERAESAQPLFGLDKELRERDMEKLKENERLVNDAVQWIEAVTGEKGIGSFPDNLKSGKLLCAVINKHWPGLIPVVGDRPIPMVERENIRCYLIACEKVGLKKSDLFSISDLYDNKYLAAVVQNIYALALIVQRQKDYSGPQLSMLS